MDALLQTLDHLLLQDLDVVNGGACRRRHPCLMLLVLNDRRRRQYSVLAAGLVLPLGVSVSPPYTTAQCQYSVLVQVGQSPVLCCPLVCQFHHTPHSASTRSSSKSASLLDSISYSSYDKPR